MSARMLLCTLLAAGAPAQQVLWTIDPPYPAGRSIARIGDIDGDGWDDLVMDVYTPGWPTTTPNLWFFSGRDGSVLRQGMQLGAGNGVLHDLISLGDVDQDGIDDYAVSYDNITLAAFIVEVRSAAQDTLLWSASRPGNTGFGIFLAGGLDLNGDGRRDLVASSIFLSGTPGVQGNGLVEAFDHTGRLLHTVVPAPTELIGTQIDRFTDYDRDGCDDYLVGVSEPSLRGAVDIISGRTGARLHRVYGYPGDLVGNSLSRAGDLDGDGIPDIVAGHTAPGSTGVLQAIGSVSGQILYRWRLDTPYPDFGRYVNASFDVDRDGVTDIIAGSLGEPVNRNPAWEGAVYIYSGRDGSILRRFTDPAPNPVPSWGVQFTHTVLLSADTGDPFPRFLVWDAAYNRMGRGYVFSGAPSGVSGAGSAGAGSLPAAPGVGLRNHGLAGFRLHLTGGTPGGGALLVLGATMPATPAIQLGALGFVNCTLHPSPDVIGFAPCGSSGLSAGYAFHHFQRRLAPGGFPFFAQWVALGSGPTWPGGVSEALRIEVQ